MIKSCCTFNTNALPRFHLFDLSRGSYQHDTSNIAKDGTRQSGLPVRIGVYPTRRHTLSEHEKRMKRITERKMQEAV